MCIWLYALVTYVCYEEHAPAASTLLMQVKLIRKQYEHCALSIVLSRLLTSPSRWLSNCKPAAEPRFQGTEDGLLVQRGTCMTDHHIIKVV